MASGGYARGRGTASALVLLALGMAIIVWLAEQRQVARGGSVTLPVARDRSLSLLMSPSGPGELGPGLYPNFYHRDLLRRITAVRLSLWAHDRRNGANVLLATVRLPAWPLLAAAAGLVAAAGWVSLPAGRTRASLPSARPVRTVKARGADSGAADDHPHNPVSDRPGGAG